MKAASTLASEDLKSKINTNQPRISRLTQVREGYARSFDGTKIWFKSSGADKGNTIIFCNGLGCSTFYWKHIYSYFKKTDHVVLFDWRGHGKSESPKNQSYINVDSLTEDMLAIAKKLRIKKAIFAGHSMGTQILFRFYQKYPHRVSALIPCFGAFNKPLDTFYNNPSSKYLFSLIYLFNHTFPNLANKIGYLMSKNPFWFQMGSLLKMMNPGLVDKTVMKEYIKHFTSVDAIFLAKLTKSLQDYDAEPLLKNIKVPTMIIAAEQDTFTPVWISKKMNHLIPNSEILVIKKASHVALVEQPALINLRIEKFIQERLK